MKVAFMHETFADMSGRRWAIRVDAESLDRVHAMTEIDLRTPPFDAALKSLTAEAWSLAAVIYALCKPQADRRGYSPERFGRSLGSIQAIESAYACLFAGLKRHFSRG